MAKALPGRKGRAPAKKGGKKGASQEAAPEEEQAHAEVEPSVAAVSPDAAGEPPAPGECLRSRNQHVIQQWCPKSHVNYLLSESE